MMAKLIVGENYPIYFGAKPGLFVLAGDLRHSMTKSEYILWKQLRNRKLLGFKFRRQHPFHEIILDFFCYDAKLSLEVDGAIHNDVYQNERDRERTFILKKFEITELRFSNWEIENKMGTVVDTIRKYLQSFPLPPRGGRVGDRGCRIS
jgi:very-short-patch-repair endonuclease